MLVLIILNYKFLIKMELEKVLLVRHALSGGNSGGIIQGQLDFPIQPGYGPNVQKLTDLIIEQEQLKELGQDVYIHVVHSGLDRTFYTASGVHGRLARRGYQSSVVPIPELIERNSGILQGKSYPEAIPILAKLLPPDTQLEPTAASIYPHLYSLDEIPGGENHEASGRRAEQALKKIQALDGIVVVVGHGIFELNYLKNKMTDGNILGENPPAPYQHFSNLSVVRLERPKFKKEDRFPQKLFAVREPLYGVTGKYGPPNGNGGPNPGNGATITPMAHTES